MKPPCVVPGCTPAHGAIQGSFAQWRWWTAVGIHGANRLDLAPEAPAAARTSYLGCSFCG